MKEEAEEGAPEWITTFADLMSLLLTFFILMLTFSTMKAEKLKEMVTAIQKSMGITQNQFSNTEQEVDMPAIVERLADESGTMGMDDEAIADKMKKFAASKGFSTSISIETNNKRGIVMRIKDDILFGPGKPKLKEEILPVLDELAKIIRSKIFFISVEGHTDNQKISTALYPSNWELGADRAGTVVRYLVGEGHMTPRRFQAVSLGSTLPIAENDTEEHMAQNRRVEIVLSREK